MTEHKKQLIFWNFGEATILIAFLLSSLLLLLLWGFVVAVKRFVKWDGWNIRRNNVEVLVGTLHAKKIK
jgi:hypothetical protein